MSAPHEALDVPSRPLVVGALLTLVGLGAGAGVAAWLLQSGRHSLRLWPHQPHWYQSYPEEMNEVEARPFAEPTAAERGAQEAQRRLRSYGWVERGRIIHVPIDVAVEVYLDEQGGQRP